MKDDCHNRGLQLCRLSHLIQENQKAKSETNRYLNGMNVHLLRSPELNTETYQNVMHLLQKFSGPLRFIEGDWSELVDKASSSLNVSYEEREVKLFGGQEEDSVPSQSYDAFFSKSSKSVLRKWKDEEQFKKKEIPDGGLGKDEVVKRGYPEESEISTWDELFNICRLYRRGLDLGNEEQVVLLTDIGNDQNWFSASDEFGNNHFVHTADWDYFLGMGYPIDTRFPIAYEVAITLLHKQVSSTYDELRHLVHNKPIGCISDMCVDKTQILLKMRTGDICPSCIDKIKETQVPKSMVKQVMDILKGIQESMTFRSRSDYLNTPSRMELRGHMQKVFLTDLGDLEVRLTPRQRTLYLFFLQHPEGVMLSHLQEYRDEIEVLYQRFANAGQNHLIQSALDNLLEPYSETMGTELSRIRAAFRSAVGKDMAEQYIIGGEQGEVKRIILDRDLVKFKD